MHEPAGEPLRTVLSDPLRAMIVILLAETSLSPAELAARLEVPADRVRSHLRRLLAIGVVATAGEEPRRGVVQRYYLSGERLDFKEDYADLDQGQKRVLNSAILRLGFSEAARAMVGQSLRRSDEILARVPVVLDESGWKEMLAIQDEALAKLRGLLARMEEHPPPSDTETFRGVSVLICFESADRPSKRPASPRVIGRPTIDSP